MKQAENNRASPVHVTYVAQGQEASRESLDHRHGYPRISQRRLRIYVEASQMQSHMILRCYRETEIILS